MVELRTMRASHRSAQVSTWPAYKGVSVARARAADKSPLISSFQLDGLDAQLIRGVGIVAVGAYP